MRSKTEAAAAIVGAVALVGCSSQAPIVYGPGPVTPVGLPGPLSEQGPFQPNLELKICPGRPGTNAPPVDNQRRVMGYAPLILVNGVVLSAAPANDACMTSGFGPRFGREHKGIDLQSRPAGLVYSAGPGVIREAGVATGFGNYVLIEHGAGVFTRYAHLKAFGSGVFEGERIGFGQPIGLMGATGNATAIHLHYEVLTGTYDTPRKSFGLKAHNPLNFPAYMLELQG
ncbi:MAG: M23 family metallopeptidase [Pseudomonadota bacterium]